MDRVEKPIEGNPSLTVGARIGAPSVSERVSWLRFFMQFRGRNAHPNRPEDLSYLQPLGTRERTNYMRIGRFMLTAAVGGRLLADQPSGQT
jgi:hypothetical protein